jgi:hypothetical protein
MFAFAQAWPDAEFVQEVLAQLPENQESNRIYVALEHCHDHY